jgi:3-oxosteroid 1-dehydrogenase
VPAPGCRPITLCSRPASTIRRTRRSPILRATAPAGRQDQEDELWQAFAADAPAMLAFLEAHTPLRFELVHHPDLYVEAPGGKFSGRMVSPKPLSRNLVGSWRHRIRGSTLPQLFTYRELVIGTLLARPVRAVVAMLPTLVHRLLTRRVGMGNALIVGLLKGCLDHGCEIVAEADVRRLLTDASGACDDRVSGVEVEIGGKVMALRAGRGVVLASGGFERNAELLARHFPVEIGLIGARPAIPATANGWPPRSVPISRAWIRPTFIRRCRPSTKGSARRYPSPSFITPIVSS